MSCTKFCSRDEMVMQAFVKIEKEVSFVVDTSVVGICTSRIFPRTCTYPPLQFDLDLFPASGRRFGGGIVGGRQGSRMSFMHESQPALVCSSQQQAFILQQGTWHRAADKRLEKLSLVHPVYGAFKSYHRLFFIRQTLQRPSQSLAHLQLATAPSKYVGDLSLQRAKSGSHGDASLPSPGLLWGGTPPVCSLQHVLEITVEDHLVDSCLSSPTVEKRQMPLG